LFIADLPPNFTIWNSTIYEAERKIPVTRSIPPADSFLFDIVTNGHLTNSVDEFTDTSMVRPDLFTSPDPQYYKGAQLWINSCNNNFKQKAITAYDPATHKITFDTFGCPSFLEPGKDRFVIANVPSMLRQGEMYFDTTNNKVIIWPENAANVSTNKITLSRLEGGIYTGKASNIFITGLTFTHFGGAGVSNFAISDAGAQNVIVYKNNFIDNAGAGVLLSGMTSPHVVKNYARRNDRGFFVGLSKLAIVSHNYVTESQGSGVTSYTNTDSWYYKNVVNNSGGHHANAFTTGYLYNNGLLVEDNFALNSNIAMTFEASSNLFYLRNTFYANAKVAPISGWGGTMKDGTRPTNIYLVENTVVRQGSTKPGIYVSDNNKNVTAINNLSGSSAGVPQNPVVPDRLSEVITKPQPISVVVNTGSVVGPTPTTPTLTLTPSATTISSGAPFSLTWNSANATACTASGDWTGTQAVSGSKSLTAQKIGANTYTLSCTGTGGSVTKTQTITVTSVVTTPLDTDKDTIVDTIDNCVAVANQNQLNYDSDTQGDACDTDDDNDSIPDTAEKTGCILNASTTCGSTNTGGGTGGGVTPPPAATSTFKLGDRIKVTKNVNVRTSGLLSATTLIGINPENSIGTITEGPTKSDDKYGKITWFKVNFDSGHDGWVGADNFKLVSDTTTPSPAAKRVTVTDNVNVRTTPNGTKIGMQYKGAMGTQSTAAPVTAGGYSWVTVNFDTGVDGYVVSSYLTTGTVTGTPDVQAQIKNLMAQLAQLQALLAALLKAGG
jgi:hypothetical protein